MGNCLNHAVPPPPSKISLSFYMFTALKSSTPKLQLLSCDPVQLDPFQKTRSVSALENESCLIMSCLVGFPSRCALSCPPRQFIFHIDFSLFSSGTGRLFRSAPSVFECSIRCCVFQWPQMMESRGRNDVARLIHLQLPRLTDWWWWWSLRCRIEEALQPPVNDRDDEKVSCETPRVLHFFFEDNLWVMTLFLFFPLCSFCLSLDWKKWINASIKALSSVSPIRPTRFCSMQIALGLSHPLTVPRTCLTRLLSPGSLLKWAADWFFPIRPLPPLILKAGLCVVLMGAALNPWIEALVKRNILAPLGKWSFYTCAFWTSQLWCIMCCCCFQPTSGKQVITWCLCGCLRVWSRLLLTDGLFFLEFFWHFFLELAHSAKWMCTF